MLSRIEELFALLQGWKPASDSEKSPQRLDVPRLMAPDLLQIKSVR
jgi:hypothetical protein